VKLHRSTRPKMSPLGPVSIKTVTSRPPVKHKRTRVDRFIGPEFGLVVLCTFTIWPEARAKPVGSPSLRPWFSQVGEGGAAFRDEYGAMTEAGDSPFRLMTRAIEIGCSS